MDMQVTTKLANEVFQKAKAAGMEEIYTKAHEAGMAAAAAHTPTPMIVQEHSNPLNDNSPVVKTYPPVMGGVCGFAWINIKPATCGFARWLKQKSICERVSYYGGYDIWVSEFGQSMELKEKYAQAFAAVLQSYGIKAHSMSRMD